MANDEVDPPCRGKHELFDAADRGSHGRARRFCFACPVVGACSRLVADEITKGHRVHGTWAGRLFRNGKQILGRRIHAL